MPLRSFDFLSFLPTSLPLTGHAGSPCVVGRPARRATSIRTGRRMDHSSKSEGEPQTDAIIRGPRVRRQHHLMLGLGRRDLGPLLARWGGRPIVAPHDGAPDAEAESGAKGHVAQEVLGSG